MVRYLDTSLLVPLFIREPRTQEAQTWLAGLDGAMLASAASIKTRAQEISQGSTLALLRFVG